MDLQEDCEWKMPSTVMLPSIDIAATLEDNMQVQCLPVFGSDHPRVDISEGAQSYRVPEFRKTTTLVQKTAEDDVSLVC